MEEEQRSVKEEKGEKMWREMEIAQAIGSQVVAFAFPSLSLSLSLSQPPLGGGE